MHNHLSFGLLDFLRFFYNSGFLLQFQGYFRKGCVLEGMERYDDVCLNSKGSCSLFMLFGSCLDKIAWILILLLIHFDCSSMCRHWQLSK
jgi:hypothetical protein